METLWQDLKYAARMLAKTPGFTAVAVLTLALGIGVNTAIFSVVNGVLLRSLAYEDPGRILMVWESNFSSGQSRFGVSTPDYQDWRKQSHSFASFAAFTETSANLAGGRQAERIGYSGVTSEFFSVTGSAPILGRAFAANDELPGNDDVVILSHGFWRSYLGGNANVVGQTLLLNGRPQTIIGVMPATVRFPSPDVKLWKPLVLVNDVRRGARWLSVVARLKSEVSREQAKAEMDGIAGRLEREYAETNKGWSIELVPLQEEIVGSARQPLLLVWGAAGLILLMACANVASLMLARGVARQKELAIRAALGAGRGRLVRQLLTESVLLGLLGGCVGIWFASWMLQSLTAIGSASIPRLDEIHIDKWVFAFTMGASLLTGVLTGLFPALQRSRRDPDEALKSGGRTSGPSAALSRYRNALVVGEVALAMLLLVGAGLLLRSFKNLLDVHPGFATENLLTLRIAPPQSTPGPGQTEAEFMRQYLKERNAESDFYDRLLGRIRELPEVRSAGAVNRLPLTGNWWIVDFLMEGRPRPEPGKEFNTYGRVVTPGYFEAMGIPVLEGRTFHALDKENAPGVAVISQAMGNQFWPGEDPIGRRVTFGDDPDGHPVWYTIVGVVGDVRQSQVAEGPKPTAYIPFSQATFGLYPDWGMTMVVRAQSDPLKLAGAVRSQLNTLDASLPAYSVRTMRQVISDSVEDRSMPLLLFTTFAGLGLVLAALGVYGLLAHAVSQRTQEIGVRMALGALPRNVHWMVVGQGARLTLLGVGIGLAAALAGTRVMASLLFGVTPTDPLTLGGVAVLLSGVATVACLVPARRATRVDPIVALRHE